MGAHCSVFALSIWFHAELLLRFDLPYFCMFFGSMWMSSHHLHSVLI